MKRVEDIINALHDIDVDSLEYLDSVIKFKCKGKLEESNFCNRYFEKVKKQIDLTNTTLFVLLNQVFSNSGNEAVEKLAFTLADIAYHHLNKFFTVDNISMSNLVDSLQYFNFFIICGEVYVDIKEQEKEFYVEVVGCQFGHSELFCNFTYNFLSELLSLIYQDRIVRIEKKLNTEKKCCSFIVCIEDFKHIKVLRLR